MRAHFKHLHFKSFPMTTLNFNSLSFDPCNRSLKIRESIVTPIPKVETPLGVWGFIPSHFPTFLRACGMTLGLPSWPTTLQALSLVVSPKLGLRQWTYEHELIRVSTNTCNMTKSCLEYFVHIDIILREYFLTHRKNFLLMWKNILPHVDGWTLF
jgi:hypothetical protein